MGRGGAVAFFVLWLGYILTVDSLVAGRTGGSPLGRDPLRWLGMFAISVPGWWLFEYLNRFLNNWEYLGTETYSGLEYMVLASLSFSTVTPAVLTTAELVGSYRRSERRGPSRSTADRDGPNRRWAAMAIGTGLVTFFGLTVWPTILYPLTWVCVFMVLDPINHLCGWPSLGPMWRPARRRAIGALAIAALICGFFWELWNSQAWPMWIYHVPLFADSMGYESPKLFEMPLPGYLGYLPFGLEVYALYHYLSGILGRSSATFLRIDRVAY